MTVMCTVDNCHYWGQGNKCVASSIVIMSDALSDPAPDSYDAMQAANAETTPVETCMDTACKTFVLKDKPSVTEDHITKRSS